MATQPDIWLGNENALAGTPQASSTNPNFADVEAALALCTIGDEDGYLFTELSEFEPAAQFRNEPLYTPFLNAPDLYQTIPNFNSPPPPPTVLHFSNPLYHANALGARSSAPLHDVMADLQTFAVPPGENAAGNFGIDNEFYETSPSVSCLCGTCCIFLIGWLFYDVSALSRFGLIVL